jgi:hypothetical protein
VEDSALEDLWIVLLTLALYAGMFGFIRVCDQV